MAKPRAATLVSLTLHLAIIAGLLLFSQPLSVLIPARSDGIEVSLVTMPSPQQIASISRPAAPIKTLDTAAEINLKATPTKPPVAPKPPVVPKPPVAPKPAPPPTPVAQPRPLPPKVKPLNKKAQINDLLGDALASNTTSIRKGKALGGTPAGTSNSNNLDPNYADQVIRAVRPFVEIPNGIDPAAQAIVKVELYPNLNVKSVKLIKASGNPSYDQNVQTAIMQVKVFPPLPEGARYVDYRILRLNFRPE